MTPVPFFERLLLAFAWFFRTLFDGRFAARVRALTPSDLGEDATGPRPTSSFLPSESALETPAETAQQLGAARTAALESTTGSDSRAEGAASLLAALQRQGRFVDFLQQDITGFSDADIGAAARLVHDGCKSALASYATLEVVIDRPEGEEVTVPAGYSAAAYRLTGSVTGAAPYRGRLQHRGWKVVRWQLPEATSSEHVEVVAPAEVEVS